MPLVVIIITYTNISTNYYQTIFVYIRARENSIRASINLPLPKCCKHTHTWLKHYMQLPQLILEHIIKFNQLPIIKPTFFCVYMCGVKPYERKTKKKLFSTQIYIGNYKLMMMTNVHNLCVCFFLIRLAIICN